MLLDMGCDLRLWNAFSANRGASEKPAGWIDPGTLSDISGLYLQIVLMLCSANKKIDYLCIETTIPVS